MGILTKIQAWLTSPTYEQDTSISDWLAFLAIAVIVSFLWSRVIKQIVEN
jgi:hypothetical protein